MDAYKLVMHVDKEDGSLSVALRNAVNFVSAMENDSYEMVLVVNSKAVVLLREASGEFDKALEDACCKGLSVRVCNNALNEKGMSPDELYPQCTIVPAGVVEIVRLQKEGFAYIKP